MRAHSVRTENLRGNGQLFEAMPLGRSPLAQPQYIPMSREEMENAGWKDLDILLISGDALVDHPSFGMALLARWLIAHGYRTGVVAQPRWQAAAEESDKNAFLEDISVMGRPTLFCGVGAGAVDSMLAHYTAFRKKRSDDAYTPGGLAGARPNRASIMYSNMVRRVFAGMPIVLGGIEASLRRVTHYDFWSDALRRSILLDSKADCLVYGMGERALLDIAVACDAAYPAQGFCAPQDRVALENGALPFAEMRNLFTEAIAPLHGICRMGTLEDVQEKSKAEGSEYIVLPSHEEIEAKATKLVEATLALEAQVHSAHQWAVQHVGDRTVVAAPPASPLSEEQMDSIYDLPYTRRPHPSYTKNIPAAEMMLSSITTHRGCGGGCSFCSLALHQGRRINSRSAESILQEAKELAATPKSASWHGSISDVGGPSANMWQAYCSSDPSKCKRKSCMHPRICPSFTVKQEDAIDLLHEIQRIQGIKHVRVASGVRFDLALREERATRAYTMEFTGGQLKVAPEHISPAVLNYMRKPEIGVFERFLGEFARLSEEAGKEQYVVPYLMSAFPGCTDANMQELATWLAARGWKPQQVQCFIPTPGTVATAMFYSGFDDKGQPIYVARTDAARLRQHGILMPEHGKKPMRNGQGGKGFARGKSQGSQGNQGNQGNRTGQRHQAYLGGYESSSSSAIFGRGANSAQAPKQSGYGRGKKK